MNSTSLPSGPRKPGILRPNRDQHKLAKADGDTEAITIKKNVFDNYAGVELEDMDEENPGPDSQTPHSDLDCAKLEVHAAENPEPPKPPRMTQSARGPQRASPNLSPPMTPLRSAQENDLLSSRRVPLNGPAQPDASPASGQQEAPARLAGQQVAAATSATADQQRERLGRRL